MMTAIKQKIDQGLAPVLSSRARVLILGSMPSVMSLEKKQYYGHPQNAFWWIMGQLCHYELINLGYEDRLEHIKDQGFALWDVLAACARSGSLDSAIEKNTERANDIEGLLIQYPNIRLIGFNGQKASALYKKHIEEKGSLQIKTLTLPSTSPAYASMTRAEKLLVWKNVIE